MDGNHSGNKRGRLVAVVPWGTLVLAFAAAGALFLYVRLQDKSVHRRLEARLAALRASGEPLTSADMARLYPDPPPDRDAALLLKPAIRLLSVPDDINSFPLFPANPSTAPLSPAMLSSNQTLVDENHAALNRVPWGRLGGAWIGAGFAHGLLNVTESPLSGMLRLARLECVQAVLFAEDHKPHAAVQSIRRALLIGDTMRSGLPIHQFAKAAVELLACRTLERVVNRAEPTDMDLRSISAALTITNTDAVRSIMVENRALGLAMANEFRGKAKTIRKGGFSPMGKLIRAYQARLAYHEGDLLQYLDWNQHCLDALTLPLSNAVATLKGMESKARHRGHPFFWDAFKEDRVSFLSLLCEPHISQFLLPEARIAAHVRATKAALAIEQWRRRHNGQLPSSWAQLVPRFLPSTPIDPFNDHPLKYRRLKSGFIVYSVGPDYVDNGGRTSLDEADESRACDITFEIDGLKPP